MKNTNRGFTLVELIVVITILAILGTIAFVSLQGYTKDAKNAKVTSDVAQISQTIAAYVAKGNSYAATLTSSGTYKVNTGQTVNSGTTLSGASYDAGTVNYNTLGIKQADFQFEVTDAATGNSNKYDYKTAYVVDNNFATYEVAWNIMDQAGNPEVVLKGTYYKVGSSDTDGLISDSESDNPVTDKAKKKLY